MNIRSAEIDEIIDRSILMHLGERGYTVYFRHPETNETKAMFRHATRYQAEEFCAWLRSYVAAIRREIDDPCSKSITRTTPTSA